MSNQISKKYIIETWLDADNPQFLTASYLDHKSVIILRYCIEYLLNPFIDKDFVEYLKSLCPLDDATINKLSELLLALDDTLSLPLSISEEFDAYE